MVKTMNEKEMNTYLQKFKKCKFCGRSHKIVEEDTLTEKLRKRKLPSVRCHLRHSFYVGSYEKNGIIYDVFNARDHLKKLGIISEEETVYIITVGNKGEEFKEETEEEKLIDEEIEAQFIFDDLDFEEQEY